MIQAEKCIVIDLDGSLCYIKKESQSYDEVTPVTQVLDKLREYKRLGFYIIIDTARQMRTYDGNIGKINANTAKVVLDWLDKHDVPYDEIHFGRPWCGRGGFYVDDKTIRPDEFVQLSYEQILQVIS